MNIIGKRTRTWLTIAAIIVSIWLIAPTLIVVPLSFTGQASFAFPPKSWSLTWYRQFFSLSEGWLTSLWISIKIAALVMLAATIVGTLAALGVNRARSRIASALRGALLVPLVVPFVIVGAGLYAVYLDHGWLGTTLGFVAAHTVLAVPLVIVTVGASLAKFDSQLDLAARSLGATPRRVYERVTIPLILPGVLSGAVFAFFLSFNEVLVASFIQAPDLQTLPVRIFNSVQRNTDPTIAAVASLAVGATSVVFAASFAWRALRKSKGGRR